MYIKHLVKFSEAFPIFFFFGKSFKVLMISDKTIHKAFRIHKTL